MSNEMSQLEDLLGAKFSTDKATEISEETKRKDYGAKKAAYYKMKKGANTLRILPALAGEDTPIRTVWQHYLKNHGGSGKAFSFNCPLKMGGGRCPACEERARLNKSDNPADKSRAANFAPKVRGICRVIDRADEAAGVQIAEFSKTVVDGLTALRQNGDVYGEDYTEPFHGADILIVRKDEKDQNGQERTSYADPVIWKGRQDTPLAANADKSPNVEQMRAWLDPETAPDITRKCAVMAFADIIKLGEKIKDGARDALVASPSEGRKALKASESAFGGGTAEANLGDQEGLDATTSY
ncbi:MAG: hypothetical protein E6R03_08515 [Hyphomicrobiaceae bacterium]|nr:MAG: hypothetical protein E6R03_08515 [Hyphomicrobiaceae bacterium]